MTTFVVSTQSQLAAAVAKANGGDELVLAPSFKTSLLWIDGFNKSGGLTIRSQDPTAMASVNCLKITNSSGITVSSLDVIQRPNAGQTASVVKSSNIVLDGLHVHGGDDLTKATTGLTIRYSSDVTVRDSQFDHLSGGIAYFDNNTVRLEGNRVSQIVNDGFIGAATSNLTIKDNYFTDFRHFGLIHPDCIQLFTKAGDSPAHDILITGNVYNRGSGTPVQGIWIKNDTGLAPFENVTVTNNTILGSSYQGIGVTRVGSLVMSGNLVQGYADELARITVNNTNGTVLAHNNVASWFSYDGNNVTFADNTATSLLGTTLTADLPRAIEGLAGGGLAGLSGAIQNYLAGFSSTLAVVDAQGPGQDLTLAVTGSAAELRAHADMVHFMGGRITGSNVLTAGDVASLASLGKLSLADGASLTVRGSIADLSGTTGYTATHFALTTAIEITGNNIINTGQAATVAGWSHATLAPDATVVLADWAGNISKSLANVESLVSQGVVSSISLFDKAPVFRVDDSQYTAYADLFALIANPARETVAVATGHTAAARDGLATLDGSAGQATLTASGFGNTLIGGAGDTLIGGPGKDTFTVHGHFGPETVIGFDGTDVLQLDRAMVADYRHLLPHMHQVGHDVTIDLGAGDVLTLADTSLASLTASNFWFF